jgi:1-acyl-sn-glycerol-3-phosphate acyltransferase
MKTALAAIRIVAFVVSTLGLYSLWFILNWAVPNKIYWRQVIFGSWTKSFVFISNMKIHVDGPPPKPPFFLVTNHLSYTDMAAIRAVVPGVFVAKAEIKSWFLAGRIVRDMGTIFIDRTNRRDIPRAGDLIIERLDAGEGVIVFPEGTSTKGEEVLPFNSSFLEFAARRDVPVSYASITYRTPPGDIPASLAACWWEEISFFAHLWRLFHVSEYTAVIKFGPEPVINKNRKMLAAELTHRVSELFEPVI